MWVVFFSGLHLVSDVNVDKPCQASRFHFLGGLFFSFLQEKKNKLQRMHLSIAHVGFAALSPGAGLCK